MCFCLNLICIHTLQLFVYRLLENYTELDELEAKLSAYYALENEVKR